MYDLIISVLGVPPAGMEWLAYVLGAYVLCALISSVSSLVSSIFRIPFRGVR